MKTFVITAGHSDTDSGAVNAKGAKESTLMTEFRDIMRFKLEELGFKVITDGAKGKNLPLRDAIALIPKGFLAVEFHTNAAVNQKATGVETISLPKHKAISQKISQAIAKVLNQPVRGQQGWIDQSQSARGRLGFVNAGGIIVETFFISNLNDFDTWNQKKWLVATEVAKVLAEYANGTSK